MNTSPAFRRAVSARRRPLLIVLVGLTMLLILIGNRPSRALAYEGVSALPGTFEITPAMLGLPDSSAPAFGPRQRPEIDPRVFSPVTALVVTIVATMTDALVVDNDGDGRADGGDRIRYTTRIENTGDMDAAGTAFNDTLDPNTTLVPGSENVSPLAFDDAYTFSEPGANPLFQGNNIILNTTAGTLFQITNPNQGLFANDVEFLGDTFSLLSSDPTSAQGGAVNVNPNGTFSVDYTVPGPPLVPDTFTYTLTDSEGLTGAATVTITPIFGQIILTDGGVPITVTHVQAGAAGANNGTFEDPFNALPTTQGTDIVYVHSGGVFNGQAYVVNTTQRFLGEGANNAHVVNTDQLGPINLPNVNGAGNPRPVLNGATGDAVQAGNGSEISNVQIDDATNAGLFATGLTGTLDVNRTIINGGDAGIDILGGSGTFTFTDVTITDPASAGIMLDGGSANVTVNGSAINQNTSGAGIDIVGGHTGTFTFDPATTVNATNGTGLQFDDADGTYNFNGQVTLNGGDAGIDILGSAGTFTFSDLTITDPTGTGINVDGGSAGIDILGGSLMQGNNARAVNVQGGHTGTVTFDPSVNVTATNGTGFQFNNANGIYNFNGQATLSGGDAGIDIIGSAGTFTFSDLTITDPTGAGINVDGGSAGIDILGGSLMQGNNARAVNVQGGHTGALTFAPGVNVTATNGTGLQFDNADGTYDFGGATTLNGGDAGIDILNNSSGTFTFSNTTITDPTGSGLFIFGGSASATFNAPSSITQGNNATGIDIHNGHTGTVTFDSGTTIDATDGSGLQFSDADGTYNFNGQVTLNGGDAGIDILSNSSGTFTFAGLDITDPTGVGINVDGGSAGIDILGGSLMQGNNARAVNVQGGHTGTFTFGGGTTINATDGTGLQFDNADGTYTFNGTTTLNGGDAGIDILSNSSGTFTFSSTTTITNPAGNAFNVENFDAPGQIDYDGSISVGNSSNLLIFLDTTAPGTTINFNNTGANTLISNQGGEIDIFDADGDVNVTTPTTLTNTSNGFLLTGISIFFGAGTHSFTDVTIDLNDNAGYNGGVEINSQNGTVNFTNLNVTTNDTFIGAVGYSAAFSNIVNVLGANNNINSNGAAGIELLDVNDINMTFDDVTTTNTLNQAGKRNGITISDIGGGTLDVTGTTTFTNTDGQGMFVNGAAGTYTFASVDMDNIGDDGLNLGVVTSNTGTFNINSGTVDGTGDDGVRVGSGATGGFLNLNNTAFTGITGFTANLTNSTVSGSGNTAVPFSCNNGGGNTGSILFNGGADDCGAVALPRPLADADATEQASEAFRVITERKRARIEDVQDRMRVARAERQSARDEASVRVAIAAPPAPAITPPVEVVSPVEIAPRQAVAPRPIRPKVTLPPRTRTTRIAPAVYERADILDTPVSLTTPGQDAPSPDAPLADAAPSRSQAVAIVIGTLPAGKQVTITFDALVNQVSSCATVIANQGVVSGNNFATVLTDDPDDPTSNSDPTLTPADPSGPATDVIATKTDAVVLDTVGSPGADPGDTIEYTVNLTNGGCQSINNVVYTDTVDPNTSLVCSSVATSKGTVTCTDGPGGSLQVNIGTVDGSGGPDDVITITVRATVNDPFPDGVFEVSNQGAFSGDGFAGLPTDDPATPAPDDATVTPVNAADVAVDKEMTGAHTERGINGVVTATFAITAHNNGPGQATGVSVVDKLPDGATFVIAGFSDPSDTYDPVTGRWTVGTLASGGSATMTMQVTATASTHILNLAEVTATQPDPDLRNNLSGARLGRDVPDLNIFQADLSLTKTVDSTTPQAGDEVIYTVTVHNAGPSSTAGVEVTDLLPPGLEFVSASFSDATDSYDPQTGLWLVGPVKLNQSATLTLTARVTGTGTIVNTAEVTRSHLPDPDSGLGNASAQHEDDDDSAAITVQQTMQPRQTDAASDAGAPARFELGQNYPNPFNPETVIPYAVPEAMHVRMVVYDMLGREVEVLVDAQVPAGRHEVVWRAAEHATDVYLVRMQAGGLVKTQRVTLVK